MQGGKRFKMRITVIGLGRVGLPFAAWLASKGHHVCGHDIDRHKVLQLIKGNLPFKEPGLFDLLKATTGDIFFEEHLDCAIEGFEPEVIFVTIGTKVDQFGKPSIKDLMRLVSDLNSLDLRDKIVAFRSTLFIGATNVLLEVVDDAAVVYCPERIAEGEALFELDRIPQIVAACDNLTEQKICELFSSCGVKPIVMSSFREAEFVKLMCNAYRYSHFAIANSLYRLAIENGIDFYESFQAARTNYPRMAHMPQPGWSAGYCLRKDTLTLGPDFVVGRLAEVVNEGLADYIVESSFTSTHDIVVILGMAAKANVDDFRDSLSYRLKGLFENKGARVIICDPNLPSMCPEEAIKRADLVIVGAPHIEYLQYRDLLLERCNTGDCGVWDVWNLFDEVEWRK
jgi:UDP-N-acetyl-D-mannosaminuronic acid dehydrogenase